MTQRSIICCLLNLVLASGPVLAHRSPAAPRDEIDAVRGIEPRSGEVDAFGWRRPGEGPASRDGSRPNVAILIYEDVQIIDHTAPWEVLGQYSLNNVYTVAKDTTPVTTFMGMRVLPSYGFSDHPKPDVVVVPGGDARDVQRDPAVLAWIRENVASSRYVLGVCSGVMLLAEAGLAAGHRTTTYYELLDDLRERYPAVTVVEDELVVVDGKLITTTGTGIEGALQVLERLHGEAWARVVALNLEHQPVPADQRTPRAWLADMNLPSSIYAHFPWRQARLERYEGDRERWDMVWEFDAGGTVDLADSLRAGLLAEGWDLEAERTEAAGWRSRWRLEGRDGGPWRGLLRLARRPARTRELAVSVERDDSGPSAEACQSVDPSWSPDGRWMLFASNCDADNLEIYRMAPDGSNRVRLTRTPGSEHGPVYAPDGSRIAYAYGVEAEDSEIWTMMPDGSDARQVTQNESTEWGPTWSPDGQRLAFESRRDGNADIWMVDLGDGQETRLTDDPGRDVGPAWSPGGSTIAFQSNRTGHYSIFGVSPDGGEERRILSLPADATSPSWSPDSRRLVFAYYEEEDGELWTASREGGDPARLTRNERTDFAPAWSPDGRTIAFIARGSVGTWDVWTIAADGSNERRLTEQGGG